MPGWPLWWWCGCPLATTDSPSPRGCPGRPGGSQAAEQVAQGLGVGAEGFAAVAGEGDGGDGHGPVPGLFAGDVVGFFEFAQVDDQVAGGEPDHVLQAGEGECVAVGQCRQRRDDLQPGGDVDQRVEVVGGHGRSAPRCCCQAMTAARPRSTAQKPTAATAHDPACPANAPTTPTTAIASPMLARRQPSRATRMAPQAKPGRTRTVVGYR